ncbi:MAG: zinc ribbon domain-containing protein [Microbacterium sp. 69-7]|uniref:zinc ribbon domain-containing protein n=1 Tax=Microbacterium sp. 69-7 TaxID=1895784 RepID=UPI000962DB17|nr:zinc ribbon domain-containing protein [Microbacterium sp. 69-7]OJU47066.1 MAG: zinc ribbon domain-containing protein [Microbacterium sp. 69-7]
MSDLVPFTDNFNDLSNADGYQFEFRCERCGNGYRSAFRRDPRAAGQKLARGLGNLFGGSLYEISSVADRLLDRGTISPAKDEALRAATAEIAPRFHQCRACSDWGCGDVCWNDAVGQCVRCSPIATEELAQLQAEARRRQMQERLETVDLLGGMDLKTQAQPRCAACGAQSHGGKFCGECGSPLAIAAACRGCATDNPTGAKFCAECGTTLAG